MMMIDDDDDADDTGLPYIGPSL